MKGTFREGPALEVEGREVLCVQLRRGRWVVGDLERRVFPAKAVALVLHDPARWRLLRELAKDDVMPVKELARRIGKSQSLTSRHLRMLREAGMVVATYN
ncbi:MAG: transcriptional regulator, partial [Armatimonadetes bacterium]|nr:transcriptional regulator [Akkermansiaceae bacterium]